MKFSLPVPCGDCGKTVTVETAGAEPFPNAECPTCHSVTWIIDDGQVSNRIWRRAEMELRKHDWSLAIILSAMAVECELSFQFFKWTAIDADLLGNETTPELEALWGEEFRKMRSVRETLDGVSRLLTGLTFRDFFLNNDITSVLKTYPQLKGDNPFDLFDVDLFRKRNRILHKGEITFSQGDAETSVRLAMSLLQIIAKMDRRKYDSKKGLWYPPSI